MEWEEMGSQSVLGQLFDCTVEKDKRGHKSGKVRSGMLKRNDFCGTRQKGLANNPEHLI